MPRPSTSSLVLLASAWTGAQALSVPARAENALRPRATPPAEGYFDPTAGGGTMLTTVLATYPAGLGEPLNVIVSGNSDGAALSGDGWLNWYNSVGFAGECLGQHIGNAQKANLGDGNGLLNQTEEERWAYGDLSLGTCQETINGGNHFRWWVQNGTSANSGAIFMAASYEMPLSSGHNIVPNGYDLGRDLLVGNATSSDNGTWTAVGWSFNTTVEYVSGLLENGTTGINHDVPIDGQVAVLTVRVTHEPDSANNTSAAAPSFGAQRTGAWAWTVAGLGAALLVWGA